jgi:hypothetical protein
MMLQAFPSAQSSITADSPRVYLFAVEDFSLDALRRACRKIVRGEVADLKADFPPAAPKLAQIVKDCEGQLHVERWEADRLFVEVDSDRWRKLEKLRNDRCLIHSEHTMRDGTRKSGWYYLRSEVEEADRILLPPPMPEAEMVRRQQQIAKQLRVAVGDPDGDRDLA